jgi:nitrogen fixation/metabolism regulation signal transduction histidine kinase
MNANSCGKGLTVFSLTFVFGTIVSVFSVNTQTIEKEVIKNVPQTTVSSNPNPKGCEETLRDKVRRRIVIEGEILSKLIKTKAKKQQIQEQRKIFDELVNYESKMIELSRKKREMSPDNENRAGYIDLFYRCEDF